MRIRSVLGEPGGAQQLGTCVAQSLLQQIGFRADPEALSESTIKNPQCYARVAAGIANPDSHAASLVDIRHRFGN
jgi:hypothetical protein